MSGHFDDESTDAAVSVPGQPGDAIDASPAETADGQRGCPSDRADKRQPISTAQLVEIAHEVIPQKAPQELTYLMPDCPRQSGRAAALALSLLLLLGGCDAAARPSASPASPVTSSSAPSRNGAADSPTASSGVSVSGQPSGAEFSVGQLRAMLLTAAQTGSGFQASNTRRSVELPSRAVRPWLSRRVLLTSPSAYFMAMAASPLPRRFWRPGTPWS